MTRFGRTAEDFRVSEQNAPIGLAGARGDDFGD
jgi:hypothetical protein